MKVAIFTDAFSPQINGVSKTIIKFVEYMEKHNIEYRIFAPAFKNIKNTKKVIRFKSFKFVLYPECRISIPSYSHVNKELDLFKPDIIHVVTEFSIGICGLRYAKAHGIPVVSSYETNIPQYLKYYHFKLLENKSWTLFKWFHGKFDRSYCPSETTLSMLEEKGFENFDLWSRGIEIDKFSPKFRDVDFRKKLGIDDKIVFAYVGRVSPEKDLNIMVDVANKLNEKYYDKIHFLVAGDGPYLKKLKKIAPSNMEFLGFVTGADLSKVYASSDVFLFTSPTETLGFVILEAMASGLPLVCCNEGGVKENLRDGYNAIACREKNVEDFYLGCKKLIEDPELRKKMAKSARAFALKKDWENTFDNLIKSYDVVINQKSNSDLVKEKID